MKKLIYLLIIISLTTCKAQKTSTMEQEIIIPQVTKEFETFDIETFNKEKKGEKRIIKVDGKLIEEDSFSTGYIRREYYDTSYFKYNRKFYLNLGVSSKGIIFNNGSQYGIWYEYDEQGNLVNEINTDEGYDFGWVDVIRYCEKHKIPLTKGYKERGGFQTIIFKKEVDTKKVWEITHQISGDELEKIKLDGKTGEELKREKIAFINH